ncbi:MAG TPA: PRC-barrel domain-containing protein [bacterium]|nr:PRC-barrel domain-containing protein [bacterium]
MIRSIDELRGYTIKATDGRIGGVHDFYFDDNTWKVRYVAVDTGDWLPGRRVLISPAGVGPPDWKKGTIPVLMSKEQIRESPSVAMDKPVSRQEEERIHEFWGWQPYWMVESIPAGLTRHAHEKAAAHDGGGDADRGDSHLRSVKEVVGYHIGAVDGEIGHVEDFLVNDELWTLHWMVVDTRNWLPGRKVLVSPLWIDSVDWPSRKVKIDLTRDAIEGSPKWEPGQPMNEELEKQLYDSYGRPVPASS